MAWNMPVIQDTIALTIILKKPIFYLLATALTSPVSSEATDRTSPDRQETIEPMGYIRINKGAVEYGRVLCS
ncbi:hypothetical protein J3Q64DRAFT_1710012 [Phycomyces blakesleeanus]|uniref:Uncharacterized protein n=1 Tax=Phycomyces blakesleeanus TaxID=4837 RepID=A0ABR3BFF5_PHYBL